MPEPRNTHLSFSRVQRFETCPLSYRLHYIDKLDADPGVPLRFGKAVHAVLERLVREQVDEERSGPLSEDRAAGLWQEAWSYAGLAGVDVFQEGLDILRQFVREQGALDHHDVLAVEKEFHLQVGPFEVIGFIDRVDRVDDESVEVIDFKTNRTLFTREEVDASLQLGLYHVAAQQIWPWAKRVKLTYWMLRHGLRQTTERTPEQIDAVLRYVETLGRQTEVATEFPPRLNPNCVHCDHRQHCPAYAEALKGKRNVIAATTDDLEAVAREREEVARLVKVLGQRKDELESVLKAHIKERGELVLGGVRYAMFNTTRTDYPLAETVDAVAAATGRPRDEVLGRLAAVDNKALEALLKELGKEMDRPRVNLLKAEIEANATKTHSPRFWAKEVSA